MSIYADEDIIGLQFQNGEVVCRECTTNEEWNNMKEDELITEDEDTIVFCDRCKKKF